MSLDDEQVELFISCRNLLSQDIEIEKNFFAKVKLQCGKSTTKLGKTEILNNTSNPNFKKSFIFNYIFEIQQFLEIEIYDRDATANNNIISKVQVPVGAIAGSKNWVYVQDLKDSSGKQVGKIILKLANAKRSIQHIYWQWLKQLKPQLNLQQRQGINLYDADFDIKEKNNPFLKFYRKDQDQWSIVHETESIDDYSNLIWKPFSIDVVKLCNSNYDEKIKVECYDQQSDGKNRLLGEITLTLNQLFKEGQLEFSLANSNSESSGILKIIQSSIIENYRFIEYLQGGTQLNLMVAIDFTASNGLPSDPLSLHTLTGKNQYKAALNEICEILLQYNYEKKVPLFGFGAVPSGEQKVNHCFPLTGDNNNMEVLGLQGIFEYYEKTANNCQFSGPTFFSQIVSKAMQFTEQKQQFDNYTVLLILTDGDINDLDNVLKLLIQSAKLPLSVIIIGIDVDQFQKTKTLNGDKGLKKTGAEYRDLVQFAKKQFIKRFKQYEHDLPKLAEKVLSELPKQLVEFMKRQGIKPKPFQKQEISELYV